MPSHSSRFHHSLVCLRAPILALLAGVGFVVQGAAGAGRDFSALHGEAWLTAADADAVRALHASGALPSLTLAGEVRRGRIAPRTPIPNGPADARPHPLGGSRFLLPRTLAGTGPVARGAGAPFARDALGRAGRFSAPSTAPPVTSF